MASEKHYTERGVLPTKQKKRATGSSGYEHDLQHERLASPETIALMYCVQDIVLMEAAPLGEATGDYRDMAPNPLF